MYYYYLFTKNYVILNVIINIITHTDKNISQLNKNKSK